MSSHVRTFQNILTQVLWVLKNLCQIIFVRVPSSEATSTPRPPVLFVIMTAILPLFKSANEVNASKARSPPFLLWLWQQCLFKSANAQPFISKWMTIQMNGCLLKVKRRLIYQKKQHHLELRALTTYHAPSDVKVVVCVSGFHAFDKSDNDHLSDEIIALCPMIRAMTWLSQITFWTLGQ